jgi:GAF domain-containing protein
VVVEPERQLADAMGQVARILNQPGSLHEQVGLVLEAACETIPGTNAVSISVLDRKGGGAKTVAGTPRLAYELDQFQYDLGEGPCLEALKGEPFQRVDDMPAERRWPRYAPLAVEHGIRSQMAVELYTDKNSLGGLNLYSRHSHAFDEETRHTAWLFATHAALAMGRTRHEEELNEALGTRQAIGEAVGIVMERYELDQDRAFQFLVRVSRNSNIKLRDVAREIVAERNTRAAQRG